ncbi:hypothetical protein LguiB_012598 [Lonicera macranthoides]
MTSRLKKKNYINVFPLPRPLEPQVGSRNNLKPRSPPPPSLSLTDTPVPYLPFFFFVLPSLTSLFLNQSPI